MNFRNSTLLLAATSVGALMLAAAPASAFNKVNWTWDAHIDEVIEKNVEINIELDPTGMVMLEDLQVFIGDLSATSQVNDIYNYQNGGGMLPDTLVLQWQYGIGGVLLNNGFESAEVLDANVDETDIPPDVNGTVYVTVDLTGLMEGDPLDAVDLPEVVSTATAVANNTSIESDVAVQLHEGQFVFNAVEGGDQQAAMVAALLGIEATDSGINSNLVGAGILGVLAIGGGIEAAEISATSDVYNILNATVDSSATAVANNLTVDIDAATPGDALLIGDVVQFAVANVDAHSHVRGVYLHNYTNLGVLDRPIVSSVATAVGNNKSITVRSPLGN